MAQPHMASFPGSCAQEPGSEAKSHAVGSHLSKHVGTGRFLDNNQMSETIPFVYKAEHFPFNAQQNIFR